ncbi:MAG: hypothetical protein QOE84_3325 [Actinomycetota bacterium]|jgi:hypothetical protein|nr:hypothetical protein [Actinomycetota bacterium]
MTRAANAAVRQRPTPNVEPVGRNPARPLASTIGLAALAFSALYFVSDAIEVAQGGFSVSQLWLTLVSEAAIPLFVLGLARVQRRSFGRLGWASAWAYAYSFTFFTCTVVYALVNDTRTYAELSRRLGPAMLLHGTVMVVAGIGFAIGVLRARVLPRWTAAALMSGVILVALTQTMPTAFSLAAVALRDGAFAGMGWAVLRWRR